MALTLNPSHQNNTGGRVNLRESLKGLYCPFHCRGYCKFGVDCSFSHDNRSSTRVPDNVCYFNLTKQCFSGDECRFLHIDAITLLGLQDYSNNNSDTTNSNNNNNTNNNHHSSPQSTTSSSSSKSSDHIKINVPSISSLNCSSSNGGVGGGGGGGGGGVSNRPLSSSCSASSSALSISTSLATPLNSTLTNSATTNLTSTTSNNKTTTSNSSQGNKLGAWSSPLQITPSSNSDPQQEKRSLPLCPFARVSDHCPHEHCTYLHGEKCDFCNCLCLHPYNSEQRDIHRDECIKEHEREMEQAFAIQRSSDKACGICMDIIMDKELPVERRFGILEKCDHVFCLTCIRKWRQTEQLDKKTIRSCPECRIFSAFVIPSQYWYDSGEEKDRLITNYKKALSQKPCKHFNQGQGTCPFAGACFYLHAYPDGRKADMPPPTSRRRNNNESESSTFRNMLLWNYLEFREDNRLLTVDYLELLEGADQELLNSFVFSDTEDESEWGSYADFGDL